MTDDERDMTWLRQRVEALETELYTVWQELIECREVSQEVPALRRLAWEGWERALAWEREVKVALAETTRINQILGEWEDLERETRRERDQATADVARLAARVVELERFLEDPCPPVRTGPPKRAVCRPIVEIEYDGET